MQDMETTTPPRRRLDATALFVAAIALGSFLLFMVQPMVARMALPRLGGSPAVWNSAMLVYQTLLLAGYAYAHALGRLPARWQAALHAAALLCAGAWLPIGLASSTPRPGSDPVLWTPLFIAASIGPLFLVVASQAPLLQRWAALTGRADPYPLYAASNLGSFAGLLAYPLAFEPFTGIDVQRTAWSIGYVALAIATFTLGIGVRRRSEQVPIERTEAPRASAYARWIAIAAIPSALMLSTTTYLTTDIVSTPLLWALPLGVYLLTFVAAFSGRDHLIEAASRVAPTLLVVEAGLALSPAGRVPGVSVPLGLATLYAVGVALHGRLNRERPGADHLTAFYLAMSAGGALGGAFCALVAPMVFDWIWEHPLLLIVAAIALPPRALMLETGLGSRAGVALSVLTLTATIAATLIGGALAPPALVAVAVMAGVIVCFVGTRWALVVATASLLLLQGTATTLGGRHVDTRFRSYFGSYRIVEDGPVRVILSGTTMHGMQRVRPRQTTEMLSYYGPTSGVAAAFSAANAIGGRGMRVGVIGLGAGMLACYARPDQRWTFFEIDPTVVAVARDRSRFSFLSDCAPRARIVEGDARLAIEAMPRNSLDVLVVDAFSSDAIPLHLVTREAFDAYSRVVGPRGIVISHISNRHLDLEPVMAALSDWHPRLIRDAPRVPLMQPSTWVVLTRDAGIAERIARTDPRWASPRPRPGFAGWTDARASIVPFVRF